MIVLPAVLHIGVDSAIWHARPGAPLRRRHIIAAALYGLALTALGAACLGFATDWAIAGMLAGGLACLLGPAAVLLSTLHTGRAGRNNG